MSCGPPCALGDGGKIAPAAVQRLGPATTGASVAFLLGEQRAADRVSQRLFGRTLGPHEYAGLTGAPNVAQVEVGATAGRLYLELRDPAATARGYYYLFRAKENVVLLNDGLRIDAPHMRRRGLGLRMFRRQVRNAAALGIHRIETLAGRTATENGYYTWPRYGFQGRLPASVRRLLPSGLRSRRTLLDLMLCEEGRAWWREHGVAVRLNFDLTTGSQSRHALAMYIRERSWTRCEPARIACSSAPPNITLQLV